MMHTHRRYAIGASANITKYLYRMMTLKPIRSETLCL